MSFDVLSFLTFSAKERAAEKKAQVKAKQAKMFGAFFAKPQDGSPKAGSSSASAGDDLPGVSRMSLLGT